MNKKNNLLVRTRFAPSPTGELHLGGARTSLFNYLLAKKCQGKFILRIEDTDQERSEKRYISSQYNDLLWLGLKPDESPFLEGKYGPYQQTKRLNIYQKYAQKLVVQDKAYYCFCTKEELAQEKARFLAENGRANYQYSRKCLKLSLKQVENLLQAQRSYVLRLKIAQDNNYAFQDLVRGKIIFQGKDIEDFVIFRSNGLPLLNFSVVIDDYLMKISHVLRGEEHLSNTAKQLVLYQAFD
jgi:nondiscriminating glutamyl-tRNA synthetase